MGIPHSAPAERFPLKTLLIQRAFIHLLQLLLTPERWQVPVEVSNSVALDLTRKLLADGVRILNPSHPEGNPGANLSQSPTDAASSR